MQTLTIIGLGRIGCVTAACLADLGHQVWGVDIDEQRVASVSAGRLPFYESQLQPILRRNVDSGRLKATTDLETALVDSSIAMVCVNTGSASDGKADLTALLQVVDRIDEASRQGAYNGAIVIRSTVPPGTIDGLLKPRLRSSGLSLIANPEFLREGSSVMDFMRPSLIVIGAEREEDFQRVRELYSQLPGEADSVSLREAEVIKYACNAFHALKIAFANEIGSLCNALGMDGERVMNVLSSDDLLNSAAAYLRPGFAFGGYCLPKDTKALSAFAAGLGVKAPLLGAILPSNEAHLQRSIEQVMELGLSRVGVFGLSFKAGTDDLRGSSALVFVEELIQRGIHVSIFDPLIGAVESRSVAIDEYVKQLIVLDLNQWLGEIQGIALTQPPDAAALARLAASGLPMLNLWRSNPIVPFPAIVPSPVGSET